VEATSAVAGVMKRHWGVTPSKRVHPSTWMITPEVFPHLTFGEVFEAEFEMRVFGRF
jgi:hypothetical protein